MGKRTSFFYFLLLFRDAEREREREEGREEGREGGSRFPGASNFHEVTDLRTLPTIYKNGRVTGWNHWKRWKAARKKGKGRANGSNPVVAGSRWTNGGFVEEPWLDRHWGDPILTLAVHDFPFVFARKFGTVHGSDSFHPPEMEPRWHATPARNENESLHRLCRAAHVSDRAFSTPLPRLFIIHAALPISSHSRNPNSRF